MMDDLLKYIETLVTPIRVCVIDAEEEVGYQIEDALSVYNCNVQTKYDPQFGCTCLQTGKKCHDDLVFVADNVAECLDVIKHIEKEQPEASIVVLTRTPGGKKVAEIMRHGVYTFLTKNGSFTAANVKNIFRQLNLRLHLPEQAEPTGEAKLEAQPA